MRRCVGTPLFDFYQNPFPDLAMDWLDIEFLALDFETTGFDKKHDQIISVGHTVVYNRVIRLSECVHELVRPSVDMPAASAVIHGILDDRAQGAEELEQVLPRLLEALQGRVMIAHNIQAEFGFLNAACKRVYNTPFVGPMVCTLQLEIRRMQKLQEMPHRGELRLANARLRYGLPRYPIHNALTDAISAAELFLAQMTHRGEQRVKLRDIIATIPRL
jgi:DNA polymerase-3 subunit epsilon